MVPPYGIKISAPVPDLHLGGTPVLPILLREDTDGRIQATDFTKVLTDATAAAQSDSPEA
ncbi:hypothetical protein [Streptomyces sp. NPDC058092]|uniref:hypothetical protein n=1 Tax=Streptomyces sp. NPDC058092 TaxID=3346336 RepID=UPI0036EB4EFB